MWQNLLEVIGYLLLFANVVHAVWMMKRVLPVDRDNDTVFCMYFNLGMATAILLAFPFRFMVPFRPQISPWAPLFLALASFLFYVIYNMPILYRTRKYQRR